jgi:hypothetical protein
MIIQGSLLAIGTESSRIQFEPAPLQSRWQYLRFADSSSGMLDYVDIRGSGGIASTAPWAYGALRMSSTHGVAVWHSHIYRNNNSGILATSSAALDIQYSLIEANVYGISVIGGAINMAHSWVRQNNLGIFFNHASPPAVQSTITRSDVSYNHGVGVKLNEVPTIPDDKYPSVRYSNLTDNNPDPPWTNTEQIGLLNPRWDAYPLWDDNFWGGNVLPILCPTAPWPIHLFYVELLDAGGPIPSHEYVYPGPDQEPETCDGDDLQVVGYSVVKNETNAPEYPI